MENQDNPSGSTGSEGKNQEKICEYMFPISSKDLNDRKLCKTRGGTDIMAGGNSSYDTDRSALATGSRANNKSYTDTGGVYIYVFRNNDPFFHGKKMLVTEKIYRNWEQFIISVIKNLELVKSSCRIFELSTGQEVTDCSDLIDGEKYIVACKNEKLNLNINYRTIKENKEYELQKGMEEKKKHMIMNEKYRKKKNYWIYKKEKQRLNVLENKREIIEHNERGVEDFSKKRELLRKFKLERINQEEKRIRYKQRTRENGNYVINRSLVTVQPERVFDRESKGYRIYLHKNGDYISTGTRFVLNFNNSSSLLAMILNIRETLPTEFWFARRIFDVTTFKRIQKIEEIEDEKHYIITGKEILRKDQPYKTEEEEAVKFDPVIIHVYPNGDGLSIPTNVRVTPQKFPTIEKLIRYIDGNMHLITGCIKILYNMSGKKITSVEQLENEQEYVAASYNEPFYNIKYNVNSYKKNKKHNRSKSYAPRSRMNEEYNGDNTENINNNGERSRNICKNNDSRIRSRSVAENTRIRSHSRSASDYRNINKTDPKDLRKIKTATGSTLRSEMKNDDLKSCLAKNKTKEKISVSINSNPNIFNETEPRRKLADYRLSNKGYTRIENQAEGDEIKQFTSESGTTNYNLSMPRKY